MNGVLDFLSVALLAAGVFFFAAGAAGLLRFPDLFSRLHVLTKADNLGLGFVALAMALMARDPWTAGKLLLVWALVAFSAATTSQLLARAALESGRRRRRREA